MKQLTIGQQFYFISTFKPKDPDDPDWKPICSFTVGKVKRKYVTFSSFNQTVDYDLNRHRYNIEDNTVEYLWGTNDWIVEAKEIFSTLEEAAEVAVRRTLVNIIMYGCNKEKQFRNMPLDLLQSIESHLDLNDLEIYRLTQLRKIIDKGQL